MAAKMSKKVFLISLPVLNVLSRPPGIRPAAGADDALGAHRHDLDGRGLVGLPGGLDFHKTTHVVSIDHVKYKQNSPNIYPVESSHHSFCVWVTPLRFMFQFVLCYYG